MSEKMIFCIGEGKYESKGKGYQQNLQIFNTPVTEEEYQKVNNAFNVKNFNLPTAVWIDIKDIKNPTTIQSQLGGYLKVLSYKDAWKELWSSLSNEDKTFFKTLPHFSWSIFTEITGIEEEPELSLSGKKVEVKVDGRTFTATID